MNLMYQWIKPDVSFEDLVDDLDAATEKAAKIISEYCADDCAAELEEPPKRVDTGRLKNSIEGAYQTEFDGATVIVGTNVKYAIYVHQGTRRMAPNRFLRNGILDNVDEYKEVFEKALKGV